MIKFSKQNIKVLFLVLFCILSLIISYFVFFQHKVANYVPPIQSPARSLTLLKISGKIILSGNKLILRSSDSSSNYHLITNSMFEQLRQLIGSNVNILALIRLPNPEFINGKKITSNLDVLYINNFPKLESVSFLNEELLKSFQQRIENRRKLHLELLKRLNKDEVFDAVKGQVIVISRKVGEKYNKHYLLSDENGDIYLLVFARGLMGVENMIKLNSTIIAVGQTKFSDNDFTLEKGEIVFSVAEIFDEKYKKIDIK
jgi:hypothetical protein